MRPTRDEVLMQTAEAWAARSTCSRLHVGAVASRNGRILAQGYNGVAAGLPHCDHACNCLVTNGKHYSRCRSQSPCLDAVHAELNIVAWAARHGVRLDGAEVHCTDSPCLNCAMALVNSGITKFTYKRHYRLTSGVELMEQAGITIVDISVGE